jgi:hypothetical protein
LSDVDALYRLALKAVEEDVPILELLNRCARFSPEDAEDPIFAAVGANLRLAAIRLVGRPTEAGSQSWTRFESGLTSHPGGGDTVDALLVKPAPIVSLSLQSPFEVVQQIPWDYLAGGSAGLLALVKSLEYAFNAPGRIRAERAKLEASIAESRWRRDVFEHFDPPTRLREYPDDAAARAVEGLDRGGGIHPVSRVTIEAGEVQVVE